MKLFTVGPVEMFPETLRESSLQLPYFRTSNFSEVVLKSEQMMLELSKAPEHSRVIFLTASGTGAMEASVINCLDSKDFVLTIDGGSFGHRFVQICERHRITQCVLSLDFEKELTYEMLETAYQPGMTALLVNLHETSIGKLYSLDLLSKFCKNHNLLFIVDAISAFLADPINMEKAGIDILITSSQKALALSPGLSMIALSPRAIDAVKNKGTNLMYFDFKDYLKDGERGQTPYTPAVGIILTLHQRLKHITEIGLEFVQNSIREIALDFRERIAGFPVQIPNFPHSNALTPLYFPNGDAKKVYETLCTDYGITVTPSGGVQADYLLRVGHIGNLTILDNDELLQAFHDIYAKKWRER